MAMSPRQRRELVNGIAFLTPNILGFLAFTIIPLIFSLILAFTNWDLRLHNMFKDEPLKFAKGENFVRLVDVEGLKAHAASPQDVPLPKFWRFLGNTLFFMIGIPFAIAASLMSAILLSQDLRGGSRRVYLTILATAGLFVGVTMLLLSGATQTAFVVMLGGVFCLILLTGILGGTTVYRTLFYLPHFTSGVATFILWKKLYNPHTGPVNNLLSAPLESLSATVNALPPATVQAGMWVSYAVMALCLFSGLRRIRLMWKDGELGWAAAILPTILLILPAVVVRSWAPNRLAADLVGLVALAMLVWFIGRVIRGQDFPCPYDSGIGNALMISAALMVIEFVCVGMAIVFSNLPEMAAQGLAPPEWLTNYHWAKPAIMIMGFWAAVGSNNMLLYLAGLSNIPVELYEAADIDGASRLQKFWSVTWPQLAPTTFFIVVMSVIGGLQGGFEMARTMTQGGPAGSTTTLAYFIYSEGFETGRLGYSSAVAWTLFLMVFLATLVNWKFGNRYVNE